MIVRTAEIVTFELESPAGRRVVRVFLGNPSRILAFLEGDFGEITPLSLSRDEIEEFFREALR